MTVRIRPTCWLARLLRWLRVPLKSRQIGKFYINGVLVAEVWTVKFNGVPVTSWPLEPKEPICSKCGRVQWVVGDEHPVTCIPCDIQAIADIKSELRTT